MQEEDVESGGPERSDVQTAQAAVFDRCKLGRVLSYGMECAEKRRLDWLLRLMRRITLRIEGLTEIVQCVG